MLQSIFKVCILGDGGVGKTTLVNRYMTGIFNEKLKITIGVNFYVKKFELNDRLITLQIWDFAGEDRFRFILPSYLLGACGAIFMYDITRYSSFRNFNVWMEVFKEGSLRNDYEIPLIMVGSKLDLAYKRAVSREDAEAIAHGNGIKEYLECSAKSGENVEKIFSQLTDIIIQNQETL
jgi:Ras-related protein Rab-11B